MKKTLIFYEQFIVDFLQSFFADIENLRTFKNFFGIEKVMKTSLCNKWYLRLFYNSLKKVR